MTEHDAVFFLLALGVLLASARLLGELARYVGMPLVVGELAAGVVLGPTVFGRIFPSAQASLLARPTPVPAMIGAYTTVAVVLLLVVVGLEVDLGVLQRRGRSALFTALLGTLLPGICGVTLGFLLPDLPICFLEERLSEERGRR